MDEVLLEQDAWEDRYRAQTSLWSGRPNAQLVAEAADLPPGRALDVGCGEGADAIWLAERGWQVTAVDIATVALERAAAHGAHVADRITWTHADLRVTSPDAGAYDLVTAQYMHLPGDMRREMYVRLAAAVAPGGTLLIVGHHPIHLRSHDHPRVSADMMFTSAEIAGELDPAVWQVIVAEDRTLSTVDGDDRHDAVVVARRAG